MTQSARAVVVIDVFTRRIVDFGIERASVDGIAVCRMFNHAVAGRPPPKHVDTDHDPLFRFHRWREYLDRVLFWNAVDLARKLETFRDYYNGHRVHRALAGITPARFAGALCPAPAALDHYGWQRHCRGLFELPISA